MLARSLSRQQRRTVRVWIFFSFPFVVTVNICKYSIIPPPVRLEVVTLAATMLIPIPLLRGLLSVRDTTSGSGCATYLKILIITFSNDM